MGSGLSSRPTWGSAGCRSRSRAGAGARFVVLKAGAFGPVDPDGASDPLPVVPWIWIEGPERVAMCLRRAGREAAFVRSNDVRTRGSVARPWRWRGSPRSALEQAMLEPGRSRALALALTAGLFIVPGARCRLAAGEIPDFPERAERRVQMNHTRVPPRASPW